MYQRTHWSTVEPLVDSWDSISEEKANASRQKKTQSVGSTEMVINKQLRRLITFSIEKRQYHHEVSLGSSSDNPSQASACLTAAFLYLSGTPD